VWMRCRDRLVSRGVTRDCRALGFHRMGEVASARCATMKRRGGPAGKPSRCGRTAPRSLEATC
jgi:hypothetical protein